MPPRPLAHPRVTRRRTSRTTRASAARSGPPRACARPFRSRGPSSRRGSTLRAWPTTTSRSTGAPSPPAFWTRASPTYSRTVLYTTHDVHRPPAPGRQRHHVRARLGTLRRRHAKLGLGLGASGVARDAALAARPLHQLCGRLPSRWLASDGSWKVSVAGPDPLRQLLPGRDLRRAARDSGVDESARVRRPAWAAATIVGPPAGVVRAQTHEPIRVVATRPPGTRSEPVPGVVRLRRRPDLTGWAEIRVTAPAGTAIEVFYSEKIGDDGKASTAGNDLVFGQLQTDYYVAKGMARNAGRLGSATRAFSTCSSAGRMGGLWPRTPRSPWSASSRCGAIWPEARPSNRATRR